MHGDIMGIITLEKQESELSRTDVDAVQLIADQVATWLETLHYQDRWIGGRIALKAKRTLDSLLGVEHSLIKAVVLLLSVIFLFVLFGTWDYRVEGSVTLATDSVSYISSPYDGRIQDVLFREGDEVKKGALLVKLDTQELLLRESVEAADVIRYTREAEKNLANEALADMKIAQSRVQEAKAGLDRVRFHLGQANITAPFDGIIIEGDNRKLLSSPVSRGDLLLKIARVEGMYAKIKVHERDVDGIQEGAKGTLVFLSRPDEVFSITLDKIIPMAEVDSREGNVFVIKAKIDEPQQPWWRPGMSGIAKIEMGKRRIFWILTHRAVDFIRMYLWW